jgi:hypothetical protein
MRVTGRTTAAPQTMLAVRCSLTIVVMFRITVVPSLVNPWFFLVSFRARFYAAEDYKRGKCAMREINRFRDNQLRIWNEYPVAQGGAQPLLLLGFSKTFV